MDATWCYRMTHWFIFRALHLIKASYNLSVNPWRQRIFYSLCKSSPEAYGQVHKKYFEIMWAGPQGVNRFCIHFIAYMLRPRQNGCHFADDMFKLISLNENIWIWIKISLKFVPRVPIDNIPALVQMMAWRRPGDKPLSEPMMVSLLTHICVARPQWAKLIKV